MAIRHHEIVSATVRILVASDAVALRKFSSAPAIALISSQSAFIAVARKEISRALTLIAIAMSVIAVALAPIAVALRAIAFAILAIAPCTWLKNLRFYVVRLDPVSS